MAMHRMIISVTECVNIDGMTEFVVMNGRRWINRRWCAWIINLCVRVFFARIITAERRNVIFRCWIWRMGDTWFMVTNTSAAAVFISASTGRCRNMRSTTRGGAIRRINIEWVGVRSRFLGIVNGIRILIKKSIGGFGKGAGHSVIKYFKKT